MNSKVHLYQMTYWQSCGQWLVNDIKNMGTGRSAKWYTPMRILDLSVEDYIYLLTNVFHAKGLHYYSKTDCLIFHFISEKDAKTFCSYVNKQAKAKQYYCA